MKNHYLVESLLLSLLVLCSGSNYCSEAIALPCFLFRTHGSKSDQNRITLDFDLVYLGDGDIQVSILGTSSGIRYVYDQSISKLPARVRLVLTATLDMSVKSRCFCTHRYIRIDCLWSSSQ